MMELTYTIKFHSYWHCGSGLAAGADVDALVVKDENNLPFVPGKTIKGLIREAVEELLVFEGKDKKFENEFIEIFGEEGKTVGKTFFSNAELPESERNMIVKGNLSRYLYKSVSATAIGEDGIAIKHSLRKTEVVVPCTLEGVILDIPSEEMAAEIKRAMRFIKCMGSHRNRGLGRCTIQEKEA